MTIKNIINKFNFLSSSIRHFIVIQLKRLTSPIRKLPYFIIIGAARCGTTSLYNYLIQHPFIVPAFRKEPHFFDVNFYKGINWYNWYRAFFPSLVYKYIYKRDFITGEASPYYIFHPHAPKRIFSILPNIKIIILLRNPIDRAYSDYFYKVK